MSELVSLCFSSMKDDMAKHVGRMAAIVEQLRRMKTTLDDSLAIGILVASIQVPQLQPVTQSIKTLPEDSVTWDVVTSKLIEESMSIAEDKDVRFRASAARVECQICGKDNHETSHCFPNPLNPKIDSTFLRCKSNILIKVRRRI